MTPAHDPLDPQIGRFVREATDEMSTAQVASILGFSEDTVKRLCHNGHLRAKEMHGARHETEAERQRREAKRRENGHTTTRRNAQPKRRWTITKQALITYIVQSVRGDKTLILAAVREMCPRWLRVAETAAQSRPQAAPHEEPREMPANVIPIRGKRAKGTQPDPFSGHPDLFPSLTA